MWLSHVPEEDIKCDGQYGIENKKTIFASKSNGWNRWPLLMTNFMCKKLHGRVKKKRKQLYTNRSSRKERVCTGEFPDQRPKTLVWINIILTTMKNSPFKPTRSTCQSSNYTAIFTNSIMFFILSFSVNTSPLIKTKSQNHKL